MRGQPVGQRRHVGEQVGAGTAVDRGGDHGAGAGDRGVADPLPHVVAGQVDRRDAGAPAGQRLQRPHLGAGADHGDGVALQAQPLGVGHDGVDGLGQRRLDDPGLDPPLDLAAYLVAAQPLAPVGQHQLLDPLAGPVHLDLPEAAAGAAGAGAGGGCGARPVGERHVAVARDDPHP